jgi:hypothetical protein
MAMPDVDGVLVGGASLTADSFTRIVDGGVLSLHITTTAASHMVPNIRPKELTATECVSTKNILGESPVWSQRDQCLYWISAQEEDVWAWNLQDAPYRHRLMNTVVGSIAILNYNTQEMK